MAEDLLSDADWAEFGDAIGSLKETFFNKIITIKKKTRDRTRWTNEVKEEETRNNDFILNGLVVFGGRDNNENDRDPQGQIIVSDGYILFTWDQLFDAGLIDDVNKLVKINSAVDEVFFDGILYTLVKDDKIGPFQDRFALFKLRFKKPLSDGRQL